MAEKKSTLMSGVAPDTTSEIFNKSRLSMARRRRGLTKTELANKIGVSLRAVTDYELGNYQPDDDVLRKIAVALEFPIEFFFGDDIEEPLPSAVSFRSLSKMSAKHRDQSTIQAGFAEALCRWLEKRFELPLCDLPDLSSESSPEAAAEGLREKWGVGQLPIRNMVHLLESKGVRVFSIRVDAREVDALSTWKGGTPFVFLNCYKSAEHSRFDAAHELGHLVMHKHGAPLGREAEQQANQFASAFLMPKGSVLANAPKFATIDELRRLKRIWGVSVAALNVRLHQLQLLTDWHYQNLCVQISRRGYRTHEPDSMPHETSLVWPKVFSSLHEHDQMSRASLAAELRIPASELEENLLFSLVMTVIKGGTPTGTNKGGNPNLMRVK